MPRVPYLRLSHSAQNSLNSCERKFEFSKFYKHYKHDRSVAPEVGKALHAGFQEWLKTEDLDRAVAAMCLAYPWDLNTNPTNVRSAEACYNTLTEMIHANALAGFEIADIQCVDGVVRPAIEVPFQIELKNVSLYDDEHVPIYYIGFIDVILFNRNTGEYGVSDIKTHRDKSEDLTPKFYFDDQQVPYSMIIERALGRSFNHLPTKIISVYVDIEKAKVETYDFEKDMEDVQDWGRTLLMDIQRIRQCAATGYFPRRGNACTSFFSRCKYFDECQNRNEAYIQEVFLDGQTPVKDWEFNPWVKMELELAA